VRWPQGALYKPSKPHNPTFSIAMTGLTNTPRDAIVAVATAPGRGAVGIVRVSAGSHPDLIAIILVALKSIKTLGYASKSLQKASSNQEQPILDQFPPRMASLCMLADAQGEPIDQALVIRFVAPHSYTGEDVLELQTHGGDVVLGMVLQRCLDVGRAHGLRLAKPGEFTERAFLNGKIDLAQAEAVADLINADTQAAARGASKSLSGAFSQQVNAFQTELTELRTVVEATIDFPEEEIDHLSAARIGQRLQIVREALEKTQNQARQGAVLREGLRVVIAGQPNAGKSSLLNALAGQELAIVTPIAGTTRDKVSQTIAIEGVPIHITDTAGLRPSHDLVEKIGIERAWVEIKAADAVLFLHDLSRADDPDHAQADAAIQSELDAHLQACSAHQAKAPLLVHLWNKIDAATQPVAQGGLGVSAKTGAGLDQLKHQLLAHVGMASREQSVFAARARHVQALAQAHMHLSAAAAHLRPGAVALELAAEEMRLAQNELSRITGEFSADDLLGQIFSSFCIGK
jgi:tRNA modification GTPase